MSRFIADRHLSLPTKTFALPVHALITYVCETWTLLLTYLLIRCRHRAPGSFPRETPTPKKPNLLTETDPQCGSGD